MSRFIQLWNSLSPGVHDGIIVGIVLAVIGAAWKFSGRLALGFGRLVQRILNRVLPPDKPKEIEELAESKETPAQEKKLQSPQQSERLIPDTTSFVPLIPKSPAVGFVARRDKEGEEGRDIVEMLKKELAPESNRLVALWGEGGHGKTTIAVEAVRALSGAYKQRIIWASADKRADFTFPTLLDEIAVQLNHTNLLKFATEPKAAEVRALIASAPTLIVLDNFETISPEEGQRCADFLAQSPHPALITTRQKIPAAHNISIEAMLLDEAQKLLELLIEQSNNQPAFAGLNRERIIETAGRNPLAMQWVVAQIELAQKPSDVLDELSRGTGDAAQRVFDRSFNLPQLTDDGRTALLALSLFVPSAARDALAEIAGFGGDEKRLNEAVKRLAALRLVGTTDGGERLVIQGLTRELAKARLSKDERNTEFRQRYVAHFLNYAEAHAQPTPEDYDELEAEKDNLLNAVDVAIDSQDWISVRGIADILASPRTGMLSVHGYWDEAIKRNEQARDAAREINWEHGITIYSQRAGIIRQNRGEYDAARIVHEEALAVYRKLNQERNEAVALHQLAMLAQGQGEIEEAERLYNESLEISKKLDDQLVIASTLNQLGRLAQDQEEIEEARRLCNESLEISKKLDDQNLIAITLHNLAVMAQGQGEIEEAQRLYNESLEIAKKLGDQSGIASTLGQLGLLAEEQGDREEAMRLLREALVIFEKLKSPDAEVARRNLARLEKES